ncbi:MULTISPECIES: TAXI family TRAP transporter solute-binding subunit [Brevibacterium]|uniref:TAXI family TRAP transporter solute-binding subunit n=1 Tax=Brevibacterium salitolerans TaxID=1403566 RepID=A0ABN2WUL2_9MICO|nr:TAXI family TRAP transporter solute-binding subunit [Brevibacterium sp.]
MKAHPRATAALALTAAVGLVVSGCQPADAGGDGEEMDRISSMSIATGGTSGVYYPIGGALSGVIADNLEGTSASVEATGASVENLRLIDSGSADIAIAQGDSVDQAYNATGDFDDEEPITTRALAVLYPNVYHTVTLSSIQDRLGLECFADLEGHRYSVGDVGSGNETTTNQVFESLGLDVTSDIDRSQLGYAETSNALTSGGLDAGSWVVGEGHSGINELAATDDVSLVPMCDDEITQILDGAGGYTEHTIPGGTYTGVDEDVQTIATWNVLVVPEGFNEDQAYELTQAVFDNLDQLSEVYAPLEDYITPENMEHSPVPFHAGSMRYFEEAGIEVPADLAG